MKCVAVTVLLIAQVAVTTASVRRWAQGVGNDPDQLYAERARLARAFDAAAIWEAPESFGLRAGLRYRGPVKRELETVLSIDHSYGEGLADRALGRWYLKVAASHLYLAETFLAMDRREFKERARALLAALQRR